MAAPTYPLNHPTTPAYRTSNWNLSPLIGVSESPFTGAQQVYEHDYALWTATLSLPPMLRAQAGDWTAFFMKLHGRRGTFLLSDPDAKSPRGSITGSVTVSSPISVGDFTIALATSNNSATGIFKAGDYIQLGSGASAKLYMIVDDADSNSSGVVVVNVEPKIKTAASAGATVVYSNPVGLFRMENNDLGWDADHVSRYGISFACIEAF